ncbi:sulfatase-like hydrolase/transferase [Flammeovirga yaeyamensis]|uniref:Sulfatase-like hydrolase/transferase n=1 Tax=Flammeovirga yaeyamensis TaxID=367791 RepID=A0AAX1MYT3_9BACT|nr:sulfatase-like hydrolase/transferase [Flammeovirga yaeyamensis]MBB3696035.1 arylsulfatase A-like enzyme [Flammeovirga yaeyamensis]NMF34721.1 sulfatase-like hydrolase/transferase [Flammeovirga yaeyamensis]QWG00450.1 sulfatase-like hydrolase/transferase [Flammeovirga yaeyamensis]
MKLLNFIALASSLILFCSNNKIDDDKTESKKKKQPNIILIYADDMGRGMLSSWGQKHFTTPNIDKLVDGGMKFNHAYGSNFCAPARASLITGMHDCHTQNEYYTLTRPGIWLRDSKDVDINKIQEQIHEFAPPRENEVYLATVAKNAGYKTAQFGKLEWGFATTPERMENHGWDYHYGFYDHRRCHGFYPPFLFENGELIEIEGNTHADCAVTPKKESPENFKIRWDFTGKKQYSEYLVLDKMLEYMDENNPNKTDQPFFLYYPTQLPHGPVQVPEIDEELKNAEGLTSLEKEYATMIKIFDNTVGQIYAKCEELGILDNTIIILSSDNGHEVHYEEDGRTFRRKTKEGKAFDNITTKFYSDQANDVFDGNDGMAGLKRDNWEGGVRVPLIWYWKGKIKAGQTSNQLVNNYDIMNTMADLIGVDQVEGKDSFSYSKTLLKGKGQEKEYTVFASKLGPAIVTKEGWKLRYQIKDDVFQLYNINEDYREEKVLNDQHSEKVASLKSILLKECDGDYTNGGYPQFFEPDPVVRAQKAKKAAKKKKSKS